MDVNVKCKIIKLLGYNISKKLGDLEYGNDFLDMIANAWPMKDIIDKLDFIKILKIYVCSAKENA